MPAYAQVVVDVGLAHLDRAFDYRVPDGMAVSFGQRVRVVFSGRRRNGWVVGLADAPAADAGQVRDLLAAHGDVAWFDEADLRLYRWVADRYAGSLPDVLRHALPARVAAVETEAARWGPPPPALPAARPPCASPGWRPYAASALLRAVFRAPAGAAPAFWLRPLPGEDVAGLVADLVARCLAGGRSALVLAPDPASALPDAALAAAGPAGVDLRAGTSPRQRYRAFLRCRAGHARVAAGERGAVFTPLRDLGLVVVDDEANPAYKERRSPRHHAREVALARARMAGAACLLVGTLSSANLWRLLEDGHVLGVAADRASERRRAPRVDVADLGDPRPGARRARLGDLATRGLAAAVRGGGAAVVLAARGGQGAALACRRCRRRLECPACSGALAVDRADLTAWRCPACRWTGAAFPCRGCGGRAVAPLAAGAGRLAAELARSHPGATVARMEGFDAPGPARRPAIGVMTRGSVVARPAWLRGEVADILVLPDADALLHRPSLDAAEDALRLWLAAAGWARRVVVQTRAPRHEAVQALVRWDPEGFWRREAERRAELAFPPATSLVALAAGEEADAVRTALAGALPAADEVLGPDLDGSLLVKSPLLRGTLDALAPLRRAWAKAGRGVRIDVDPLL